jgi:hypothetical protein
MTGIKRLRIFSKSMLRLAGLLLVIASTALGLTSCRLLGRPSEAEQGAAYLRQTLEALPDFPTTTPQPTAPRPTLPGDFSGPSYAYAPPTPLPRRDSDSYRYTSSPGDTPRGLAGRFNVDLEVVTSQADTAAGQYLPPGVEFSIPDNLPSTTAAQHLLPDAEVVFSPTAVDFSLYTAVQEAGGFLAGYQEVTGRGRVMTGTEMVARVARDQSINPRLLLAVIEYRSGWLYGHPPGAERDRYPLGFRISNQEGLYDELRIAATQLNLAYYGWREGNFTTIHYQGGGKQRLDPTLNAGTAALYHLFSYFYTQSEIEQALLGDRGFLIRYQNLFGDPWARADQAGPLLPTDLEQPPLNLPFGKGEKWGYTGGPHATWNPGTPRGALDFAPVTGEARCAVSRKWVTAPARAVVSRAADNAVILDLDGDGHENTGWAVLLFHLAESTLVEEGVWVNADARLGRPSCQGGFSTGTHVHLARKYNGEWLAADGPVPLVLSGWTAKAGKDPYQGRLVKGDAVVVADPGGKVGSTLIR